MPDRRQRHGDDIGVELKHERRCRGADQHQKRLSPVRGDGSDWRHGAVHETAPHYVAYCATPLPNDQFSFFTSIRWMRTSSSLRPTAALRPSAIALKSAFFCSTVRPSFQVICTITRSSLRWM